ncbi:MAG: cadmium-translocating P-type ATPase [Planctomycetota bacterium]|jgi:Cd2+/Zn2+-exporting ATPase|nr:cadmium-translocating P-type ATPase [Planctomycetota bacterium]
MLTTSRGKPILDACSCCQSESGAGPDGASPENRPKDDADAGFAWLPRLVLPGCLFAAGLAVGDRLGWPPYWGLMLAAYLLCGWPVLREAAESAARRDFFNEFTLMGLATLVALTLGEVTEAVGVMLFYSLGEAVQEKAAGASRRSIRALLAAKPEQANLLRDGRLETVRLDEVPLGGVVLVKPGETIPLDGVVIAGSASVDASSLTGESLPETVEKGARVYGGCLCLDGDLTIETTSGPGDSMVGRILAMVEGAAAVKSRSERFITAFARRYTPAVAAAALLVAVLPPLIAGEEWGKWIYRALILLVCSCPCALFLSVPLAFFAGIGAASRRGLLIKGGQVFDALAKATLVVFDKTGTLTQGKLSLLRIEPAAGVAPDRLLELAALAESRSNHPVARAILAAAGKADAFSPEVTTRDLSGKGVQARAPEGEILIGNARLLRERGVAFADGGGDGELAAHVALNQVYQGRLLFSDRLKPDSLPALRELRAAAGRKRLYLLTGDREEAARAVCRELELDGFRAGLLPDEKVAAFRELSPDGRAVFVGDGVNDAPVIAASGVGVAMGALGSAAAVEAADAVILDDSPARLPLLFRIAAKTRRVAGENIVFALAVKTAVMILGVMGTGGLWAAVFADVGVALLAVLNSLRAARAA